MASHTMSRSDIVVKGILGSQILSVPFACALSSISVVLAARFLSKTSTSRPPLRRYFEYQSGATRPTRMVFARLGAVMVATVCVVMTIMELTIVYQTAVTHSDDATYEHVVPWTSSLVPLLTSIVSIASQSYFSDKILHQVERPRLFFPFLILMGFGSLSIGSAATIALLLNPFQGPTVRGISVSEGLFWAYLVLTTLSSMIISFILIGSYLKDRRAMIMESARSGQPNHGCTKMTSILRFFLSTYTLVFIFDLMCLITSIVSASPNFEVAFNASKAFLVLQKMMVRVMAVSYLYALLDGIPKNPIFSPPSEAQLKSLYVTPSQSGFKAPKANAPTKLTKSKIKNIQNSVSRTLNKYESEKHKPLPVEDEEGEIFSYSYPPNSACSMTSKAARTPGTTSFKYDWEPTTQNLDQPPTSAHRSQPGLSPRPAWKPSQTGYSQYPPSLPSVPPQFLQNQPLPALPKN
ncbi:hypothetical protein MJO28_014527 [Puccinia striiformis f. sp. tritici]|uniref:Uncharacterized protein n=4 Tax=Puccinia striiformis TaxID=27350 RepID=A0A0L0W2S3_9BASI|nr:hypothetical protein Pst134EA_026997 [Puccinia striiformis f. sp. tritici]KAI9629995.1 hypothetical protein KEM48_012409 [Puccinia striiformis f. sp. tritici PST-130]KNF05772.1 hypothetical protein PSTG_01169 [Puccinia striiformis f. sp. tritici PST-78]POV98797.1 hypothetical protein PSTT_14194 [Puccinia striiformis]KAH9443194.1 hypothetical protein Pst134EB_027544 [Puccinia striiformis f. sp. tritici]KAH9450295.1 hypothetical protein Pst134EA_026997 [Puccinia striiformis f. sp. tritici]